MRDIIFRVIPSLLFFVILPFYLISFLFISASPLLFLICRRANLSSSCTVDRPPSSRHTLFYGASEAQSSVFPCPIASYKAFRITSASFLSVFCIFPSVCLRLSFCFSVTKAGYLHTLGLCIYYLLK